MVWKLAYPVAYSVGCEAKRLLTPCVSELWYWLFVLPHLQNLRIAQTTFWVWQKMGGGRGTPIYLCNNKCKVGAWGTVRRAKQGWKLPLGTDKTEPQCKLVMTNTPALTCPWAAFAWHLSSSWEGTGVSRSEPKSWPLYIWLCCGACKGRTAALVGVTFRWVGTATFLLSMLKIDCKTWGLGQLAYWENLPCARKTSLKHLFGKGDR